MKKIFISCPYETQLIEFHGDPIYYKVHGIYGYLVPLNDQVLFFSSTNDESLIRYDILDKWKVLYSNK